MMLKEKPDLMILDLKMPNMSGFELLEKLQGTECEDTDIIVVTGLELSDAEVESLRRRVIEVYAKPVAREDFRQRLQAISVESARKGPLAA